VCLIPRYPLAAPVEPEYTLASLVDFPGLFVRLSKA